jgi:hypothetical protein
LAGLVGLSLSVAACGGSSTPSAQPAQQNAALAFSHCMRSHGVPTFPDPDGQGNFPPFDTGVSKQTSAAANDACRHLLPQSSGGAGTRGDQQKLAFALKDARCMRSHGFPTYPDPTTSSPSGQGSGTRFEGTGIDTKSPQFQTAEISCEKQARKALGLP